MFQNQEEFAAYLAETKAKCPEAPQILEHVSYTSASMGGSGQSYCVGYYKVIPDYEIAATLPKKNRYASAVLTADLARRLRLKQVRVQPCRREEATHISLTAAWIVWLGSVTRLIGHPRLEDKTDMAGWFEKRVQDASLHEITVLAYEGT